MKNLNLIIILTTFISCNFNKIHENRLTDKEDAEKVINRLYSLTSNVDDSRIYEIFSPKFYKATTKDELKRIIETANSKAGKIGSDSLLVWKTKVLEGTDSKSEYLLTYYVRREQFNTLETFSMEKEKENDSIKIIGYDIKIDNRGSK